MLKEYDRIATTDEQLATVRFVGKLPDDVWGPNVIAYGLEWDEPERGKNNGSVNGVSYFETDVDGAGSFLKSSSKKIATKRYDFVEALVRQYADEENESILNNVIQFGSKVAENYGFHKLNKIQSDFKNLRSVSLDKKSVCLSFRDLQNSGSIVSNLINVESLDLSFNLINELSEVWKIVDVLPALKSVNLNGNRFYELKSVSISINDKVTSVKLASTNITLSQVSDQILSKFVNLKDLSLAGNRYTDSSLAEFKCNHACLKELDLSYNQLTKVPEFFGRCGNISSINLSNNRIRSVQESHCYENVHILDLRHNNICEWSTIDRIARIFPNLQQLRINGNPVFEDISDEVMTINLIARFECRAHNAKYVNKLCKINGSYVNDEEIKNAELYFISKVRSGHYTFDKQCKRWKDLTEKYHLTEDPSVSQSAEFQNSLASKKIMLRIHVESQVISRTFLVDNSVLRLKGIIARFLDASILRVQVYYYINETEEADGLRIVQYLDDDLAVLDAFGLEQKQNLYVNVI